MTENRSVGGSIPPLGTIPLPGYRPVCHPIPTGRQCLRRGDIFHGVERRDVPIDAASTKVRKLTDAGGLRRWVQPGSAWLACLGVMHALHSHIPKGY